MGGSFSFPPLSILQPVSGTKPVWLVGMMGAGKSTLGVALAVRLGRRFLDTDREIVRRTGREIEAIFSEDGEQVFRALEREAFEKAAREGAVVALGGGAIAEPGAEERLAELGTVVYLEATPEELVRRIGDSTTRPLLRGMGAAARLERVRELLAQRVDSYRSAKITLDSQAAKPEELVEALALRILELEVQEADRGEER